MGQLSGGPKLYFGSRSVISDQHPEIKLEAVQPLCIVKLFAYLASFTAIQVCLHNYFYSRASFCKESGMGASGLDQFE